jgi:hypothetical protein
VANRRGGGRAARWRQRANAGRGGGRTGGGPSFLLLAARSPSLPAFCRGRDRQQAPIPPQAAVVADGWARRRRCRGVEARRRGGGLERLQAQGKRGRDTSNKKQALRSATEAHCPHTVSSSPVQLQGRIPGFGRRGHCRPLRRPHPSSFARLHRCTHPSLPCEWRRAATGIRPPHCRRRGALGAARGSARGKGPAPVAALDPLGATAQARQGGTPEHGCGGGGPAAIVLRVCALRRGRAAAVAAAAAARW